MKAIFFFLFILLTAMDTRSQNINSSFSGTINCTMNGKVFNGKIQSAIYSKQEDYLSLGFEDSAGRLEVTLRDIKKEISRHIPYSDEIAGEFKGGYDPHIIFFVRYFPDKKMASHYETSFAILGGGFAVDALNLANNTIKLAFEITCGRATKTYNPMKPDEKDLEKLDIKNAETSTIKFLSF